MANTLDQIIADLEAGKAPSAEAQVVEKVASSSTDANQESQELTQLRKLAESIDEQGREFARSFVDELNKLAVGVSELTPNTAAIPFNPAVQVGTHDIRLEDTAKVQAIIQKLTDGERAAHPDGYIAENNEIVARTEQVAKDEDHKAADTGTLNEDLTHKASAEIVESLYQKYFA
jgi:hypothetical protein